MSRLLIVVALIAFVVFTLRRSSRAVQQGREMRKRDPRMRPSDRPSAPPQRLVCGACGTEFDPELSAWICPKCGK